MLSFFLFAIAALAMIGAFVFTFFVWISGDTVKDDTETGANRLFSRVRHWLTRKPPKLTYRRDKKGRFRKVRRG